MTALTQPILSPPAPAQAAAPDTLRRRLLSSGRVVIGGGLLSLIVLACVATLPLTRTDHFASGTFFYDQQHPDLARQHPGLFTGPRPPQLSAGHSIFKHPWLWLGTDALGRGMFSRCLLGGTISLTIGIAAAAISVFLGVTIGLIAGYRGGWIDALLMRSVDILYGLPYILLIVLLKIALEPVLSRFSLFKALMLLLAITLISWTIFARLAGGQSPATWWQSAVDIAKAGRLTRQQLHRIIIHALAWTAAIGLLLVGHAMPIWQYGFEPATANLLVLFLAIGLVSWLTMARVIRGQVLSLRAQPFIESCRASGLTEWRVFTRHLLPNLIGPITVYATLTVPQAILEESFLSFLGIGIQPPVPTWGSLASEGLMPALNPIHHQWYMLVIPCLLLSITLLSLNFLGDGLRDVFDPKREAAKA